MKIILLLIIYLFTGICMHGQTVTLKLKNEPLIRLFQEIEKQTDYSFVYIKSQLDSASKVTINVRNATVGSVLDQCFKTQKLSYRIQDEKFIVIETKIADLPSTSTQEYIQITGKVVDMQNQPLVSVSIVLKGSLFGGTTTDHLGGYQLDGVPAKASLIFSYVGYKTQELQVNNKRQIVVKLEPEEVSLSNVIVSTGYQKIERKNLTGSVTSLKMDSIRQPGLVTVDKMLEGRVPGLIYMQNSGQAGAAPKLRIRGTSTLLGSQEPLWVVDGIPQSDPVNIPASRINDLDFVNLVGNAISGLNPNDIEQIDVLKDAAATALYGVRAANGVIVVTTKRGKPGPPNVSYSGNVSYTRRPRYSDKDVNMMNSLERVDVSREIIEKQAQLYGQNPEAYERAIIDYYNGVIDYETYQQRVGRAETLNTDWFKAVTQDVISSNHTIGISGGNQVSRYYASVGYANELGVIKGEQNKRYTGQMKFDVNYKNFKAQFSVSANKTDRRYTPSELGILNYAYGNSRAIPLYNEDGSLYYYATKVGANSVNFSRQSFNVVNEMNHSGQIADGSSFTGTANLNYQLFRGLQFNAVLSYTAGSTEQRTWFDEKTNWVDLKKGDIPGDPQMNEIPFGGELQQQGSRLKSSTVRAQADFSRFVDAGEKHQLNITLGGEMTSTTNSDLAQIRRGYYPDRGYSFAIIDPSTYRAYANWATNYGIPIITEGLTNLASGYAAATYIYDDRYVLTGSARSDFSNAFGSRSNERFLPTWSLSGRWNIHQDLLKNTTWVNMAALRLSYGSQGNMLPFQTPYTIIQKGSLNSFYQSFGSTIIAFPNPNLKWEKTDSYGAGLDFSLFNNKINGTIGYFYKKTNNAFLQKQVSQINGVGNYVVNGGVLENQGVELSFNFTPVNNAGLNGKKRGFIWRIDPQLGQVFNKLLSNTLNANAENVLVDPNSINIEDFLAGSVPVNGKSVNTFYSYHFKGLDHNGQPVFYGAEAEKITELLEKYRSLTKEELIRSLLVESGRRVPVIQGGISNYFGYRNWSFNFTFTYSLGNKIRLLRIASGGYGTYQPTSQQNLRKEFVDRWRYPGDELHTNIPGISTTTIYPWWSGLDIPVLGNSYYQMYDDADVRVVSGDYVKLQSADLSYDFDAALCKKLDINALRLSLAGSNLLTVANKALRGQDPSQSGTSPNINLAIRPVFSFNINLSF